MLLSEIAPFLAIPVVIRCFVSAFFILFFLYVIALSISAWIDTDVETDRFSPFPPLLSL